MNTTGNRLTHIFDGGQIFLCQLTQGLWLQELLLSTVLSVGKYQSSKLSSSAMPSQSNAFGPISAREVLPSCGFQRCNYSGNIFGLQ